MDAVTVRRSRRAAFLLHVYNAKSMSLSKIVLFFNELMACLQKSICSLAIIASETPRIPLESPEVQEPPKHLPETSHRAPRNTVWGLALVSVVFELKNLRQPNSYLGSQKLV